MRVLAGKRILLWTVVGAWVFTLGAPAASSAVVTSNTRSDSLNADACTTPGERSDPVYAGMRPAAFGFHLSLSDAGSSQVRSAHAVLPRRVRRRLRRESVRLHIPPHARCYVGVLRGSLRPEGRKMRSAMRQPIRQRTTGRGYRPLPG